ncbi:hypothetical protein KFL_001590190 [Klebsormidium nitens]|uniref:G8 domain-containing protein n=1 Tax=Klebsormidium nitens TaxID=105231 RepID=A0A1Y1I3H8_KLENI|nr:hypothetical protein KFL_001590190 [Klebsormidium nitens]|eukprot:GAQ83731.1 hypothetical protein KFL_001590190 [Klebsormidium nitens]
MTQPCFLWGDPSVERRGSPLKTALLLLVVAISFKTGYGALGDAVSSTCPFKGPSTETFVRWSDISTWPNGVVPGVDPSKPANVVIPCGQSILLDRPSLNLGLLNVSGHLKFLDDPSLPLISINATAIVVFGQLTIGTPAQQFSNKVNITLFSNGTQEQYVSYPAFNGSLQSVGEKVFAVVGGQVNLHGMPGGSQTPTWVHLSATARKNATSIQVDTDVSKWPIGGRVAIASTDYDMEQAETVTIANITSGPGGAYTLTFTPPLRYMHWGDDMESGAPGRLLFQKAEVALLTRNIYIQGQRESGRPLVGGHFIVYATATPQFIEGVELAYMGQQGQLGRYPIHFHICRSHANSYVRKITVRNTLQRCVVVHGTDDLLIEENVAFNSTGHCYMTEDGVEVNNTFSHNLAAAGYPAKVLIPPQFTDPPNTDNTPGLFWMANANNTLVNNAAGGSSGSGFWYQLERRVRGISVGLPGASDVSPRYIPIKLFENNTAHSCSQGVTTYERGFNPTVVTHPVPGVNLTTPVPTWLTGVNSYKNYIGVFPHNSQWVSFRNATIADNAYGVHATGWNLQILDSLVVAESQNLGTPVLCTNITAYPDCIPLDTCTLPAPGALDPAFRVRTIPNPGENGRRRVIGLQLKEEGYPLPLPGQGLLRGPVLVSGVTFIGFSPRCDVDYSVTSTNADFGAGTAFNPGHTFQNITLINCSRPVFYNPAETWNATANNFLGYTYADAGWMHAIRDADGSLIGPSPLSSNSTSLVLTKSAGTVTATVTAADMFVGVASTAGNTNESGSDQWGVGFVVSNSSHMLPLKSDTRAVCAPEPTWNAYRCWGVCYRTLWVYYYEPGFDGKDTSVRSSLRVTRVADGVSITLTGTSASASGTLISGPNFWRAFSANLIVGPAYTYTVQKIGGKKPFVDPSWIWFGFQDDSANCGLSSKVRILTNSTSTVYQVPGTGAAFPFYKYCELPTDSVKGTFLSTYCDAGNNSVLEANLGILRPLNELPLINATLQTTKPGTCAQNATCGLVASGDTWQYVPRAPVAPYPQSVAGVDGALSGQTPLATGYVQINDAHYSVVPHDDLAPSTIIAGQPDTLYLWTSFTVTDASCYRNLTVGVKAKYGYRVYLNGIPAVTQWLAVNGTGLLYSIQAPYAPPASWEQSPVPQSTAGADVKNQTGLVTGTNIVAVEVYRSAPNTVPNQIYFDFWMAAANICT